MQNDEAISVLALPTEERIQNLHGEIAVRARELWLGYGQPADRDLDIWLEAERQVLGVDPEVHPAGGASVAAPALAEAVLPPPELPELRLPSFL